jgi:hypothetical protein
MPLLLADIAERLASLTNEAKASQMQRHDAIGPGLPATADFWRQYFGDIRLRRCPLGQQQH